MTDNKFELVLHVTVKSSPFYFLVLFLPIYNSKTINNVMVRVTIP